MKACILKILELRRKKWFIVGDYIIIKKSDLEDDMEKPDFKYEYMCDINVPENTFNNNIQTGSLDKLINIQIIAIKIAKTSYSRIPVRKLIIEKLKKLKKLKKRIIKNEFR